MTNPITASDNTLAPLPLNQAALEAMPFPFAICTCDGLYVAANDLVEQLFRVPKAALVGSFNFLSDPVSQDNGTRAVFQAAVAGQHGEAPPTYYDFSFPGTRNHDRTGCWIASTFLPFRDATGQVTHVGMLIQDVSERVESEQKALRLTAMIENALDAMGTIDLQGNITYCNQAYLDLTGYGDALIGMPITTIFADNGDAVTSAVHQVATQGQWRGQLTARRADGSSFISEVSAFPLRDRTGEMIGMAATIRDLTERQAQEQRLRRLEALVENAPDAIGVSNMDGTISYANVAYRKLYGYGDDLLGRSWQTFYPPEVLPQLESAFQEMMTQGFWRGTLDQLANGGQRFPAQILAFLLRDETGTPSGLASIMRDISTQHAHENRLRMFEALVEHAAVGMAFTDFEGTFTYANASLRETSGYGEGIIGMGFPETLTPEERRLVGPNMASLFATGRMEIESAMCCRDGSTRPISVSALLIRDASGAPLAIAAIVRDLTEERARAQELRLSKFSLERLPDNIHWVDPSSTIVDVNDGACTMLGYTREELIGLKIGDIDPVFPVQNWDVVWRQLKEQGAMSFESLHRRKDGSTFPVEIVASFLEFEGREYGCVFARDISERKQREDELRTFKAIVENTPYGVSIFDFNATMQYANPAYRSLLGYDHDLAGMSGFEVIAPEDHALAMAEMERLPNQRFSSIEFHLRRADGSLVPVAGTIFLQEAPDGSQQMIGFARDLTEQKRAEAERTALQEQVIAAQQTALRELSTPLIPIAEGVVAMPLIGSIDSSRAQLVVETLLTGTAELRAHTTIIDITGVPVVDTQVANALLRAAQAVKLLGAKVILTGIRPEVAQTLVGLGVDLGGIVTRGTLQTGIAEALGREAAAAPHGRR